MRAIIPLAASLFAAFPAMCQTVYTPNPYAPAPATPPGVYNVPPGTTYVAPPAYQQTPPTYQQQPGAMTYNGPASSDTVAPTGAPVRTQLDPDNCGTPDEPKACPPMPRQPLHHYR